MTELELYNITDKEILDLMHKEEISYLEAREKLVNEREKAEHEKMLKEAYESEYAKENEVGYVGHEYEDIGDYDW